MNHARRPPRPVIQRTDAPAIESPHEILTLREVAERAGVTRLTPRKWVVRYPDTPAVWREGRLGEPHLYLWCEWEAWLRATGRL